MMVTEVHARRRGSVLGAVFTALALQACLGETIYPCTGDLECVVEGVQGSCQSSGFCAYPDGRCPSQLRYGPAADRRFECVPVGVASDGDSHAFVATGGDTDGSSSTTAVVTSTGAIEGSGSGGCTVCDDPPGPCFEPLGACGDDGCIYTPLSSGLRCVIDDPCVTAAQCDGAGQCVVTGGMQCNVPPDSCHESRGTCERDGTCSYALKPANSPCDDDDGCTTGERCDAAGVCGGGESCTSNNPCETASCSGGTCVFAPVTDGSSCGAADSARCCGGDCVDISSDEDNCGGCGVGCDADDICESVSVTSTCDPAPANTSGRCTCDGANADCPLGQLCRTVTPFNNRCTPNSAANCVNDFVDVNLCPNYCAYP
ncbi:MAG: hypothetical protein IPH07_30710 [Deltaproteobacteria bacterium]|nr:hypothetical protein [Deltaproteobacteria bacterium]MBK8715288.1 hypothetical protein [Deltaproteobacteria bacterium]MBP7285009.1 hypothetical protein [Nannocystaceae bacterium]